MTSKKLPPRAEICTATTGISVASLQFGSSEHIKTAVNLGVLLERVRRIKREEQREMLRYVVGCPLILKSFRSLSFSVAPSDHVGIGVYLL